MGVVDKILITIMLVACNKIAIFLFAIVLVANSYKLEKAKPSKISFPHWVSLCDKGHSYLFSEDTLDWNSARQMCQLLGGYIARIENRHENNCLLVHAQSNGLHQWWMHSGNDIKIKGYYVMEDETEMTWVSNLCRIDSGGRSLELNTLHNSVDAGCWSDNPITAHRHYICEKND